jgi:CubicO group peptidase (beta-lactamase class C family)
MTRAVPIALALAVAALIGWWAMRNPAAEAGHPAVDKLFAEWDRSDSPGCTVGISRDGTTLYEAAYGMASLELGVPLAVDSVLPAASVSKQFTAFSILLLARQGKLSIDDQVRKYVPELQDFGTPLTVRHLLHHTSGLRDAFTLDGWSIPQDPWGNPNDTMLRVLSRQRGLNFPPGQRFQYNNGGYNLLAHVVRRASGRPLQAFANEHIFKPLGMTSTHFHDDPALIVPRRASSYWKDASGWRLGGENGGIVGNAGLHTTVGDLLRWQRNFEVPRVGDRALLADMQTVPVLANGEKSGYAVGVNVGTYRGVPVVEHGGGDRGISTYLARYPEQKLSIAVLCNTDVVPSGILVTRMADLYLGSALQPVAAGTTVAAPPESMTLTTGQLADRAGWYIDANGGLLQIDLHEGRLSVRDVEGDDTPFELSPLAVDRFVLMLGGTPVTQLQFGKAASGRDELRVAPVGDASAAQVFEKIRVPPPSVSWLESLAGRYRSDELDVTYTVEARPGGLLIHPVGRPDISVESVDRDTFAGRSAGTVRLQRDARQRVTGFTFNRAAARGVSFERVQ